MPWDSTLWAIEWLHLKKKISVGNHVKKLEISHTYGKNIIVIENNVMIAKELNLELPYDLPITFLAIFPKELKTDLKTLVHRC